MISYWKTVKDVNNPTEETTIDIFIDRVKNGYWRELIAPIRNEKDKEKQKPFKAKLPAVTIGGSFKERNEKSLLSHSGFMCVVSPSVDLHIAIGIGGNDIGAVHADTHCVVVTLDHTIVVHCTSVRIGRGLTLVLATLIHVT